MKFILILFMALSLLINGGNGQNILQKKNVEPDKVLQFINKINKPNIRFLSRSDYSDPIIFDKLKVKPYYIIDFDKNGFKDILYQGVNEAETVESSIIMSFPGNNFKTINLVLEGYHSTNYYEILVNEDLPPSIVRYNLFEGLTHSKIRKYQNEGGSIKFYNLNGKFYRLDTLIYKYDSFINFNSEPSTQKLESISFSLCNNSGFGYFMKIDSLRNITYKYVDSSNSEKIIKKIGRIKDGDYQTLVGLIKYSNFIKFNNKISLPNFYGSPKFYIEIRNENGITKKIVDESVFEGNYSLNNLYFRLNQFRDISKWEKIIEENIEDSKCSFCP